MEGDAEALSEAAHGEPDPAATLLKVGHHGSKNVGHAEISGGSTSAIWRDFPWEWEIRLGWPKMDVPRDWKAAASLPIGRTWMCGDVFPRRSEVVEEDR